MKIKGIFLLVMALKTVTAMTQNYPDKVLHGINGPVKTFTTTSYKELVRIKNQWQPQDTEYFNHKSTHYYNTGGYIDSIDIWLRLPYGDSITHTRIVYKYQDGLKKMAKIYNGGIALEAELIEWPDSNGYVVNGFNLAGQEIRKSIFTLSETHREIKSEFFYYDTSGQVKLHQLWETETGSDGWPGMVTETDVLQNLAITYLLRNGNFDEYENPLQTTRAMSGRVQPERIILRQVEYY